MFRPTTVVALFAGLSLVGCSQNGNAKSKEVASSRTEKVEQAKPVSNSQVETVKGGNASQDRENYRAITGEEARTALNQMLETDFLAGYSARFKEEDQGLVSDALKSEDTRNRLKQAIAYRDGDSISLGPFFVDSKYLTFSASVKLEGGQKYGLSGDFSKTTTNGWVARIIGVEQQEKRMPRR